MINGSNRFEVLETDVAYIPANFSFAAVYNKVERTAKVLPVTLREIKTFKKNFTKSTARQLMQRKKSSASVSVGIPYAESWLRFHTYQRRPRQF
jgi:hypothetical protein